MLRKGKWCRLIRNFKSSLWLWRGQNNHSWVNNTNSRNPEFKVRLRRKWMSEDQVRSYNTCLGNHLKKEATCGFEGFTLSKSLLPWALESKEKIYKHCSIWLTLILPPCCLWVWITESGGWVGKEVWGLKIHLLLDLCVAVVGRLSQHLILWALQAVLDASATLLLPSSVAFKVQRVSCNSLSSLGKFNLSFIQITQGSLEGFIDLFLPQILRALFMHPSVAQLYSEPLCLISHFSPSTRWPQHRIFRAAKHWHKFCLSAWLPNGYNIVWLIISHLLNFKWRNGRII